MDTKRILKGNILYTRSPEAFTIHPNSYMVIDKGSVQKIYQDLPEKYQGIPIADYGERLIIPGFVDLHVHAPQFDQAGLGLDTELIDWLNRYTFALESRFSDLAYARDVYTRFAEELIRQGTTRACIFATIHPESTKLLFEILIQKGISAYVGKVNMDRNSYPALTEETEQSIQDTGKLIAEYGKHPLVKPILTPRFAPSCTDTLLKKLGELASVYQVPVQSHLSENRAEIQWVSELFPQCESYSQVYESFGLFGQTPTLMAHGIYLDEKEVDLIRRNKVMLVHCPDSNMNLASGMMPIRRWQKENLLLGLGSDVGGGHRLSMAYTMISAIQTSKILQSQTGEKGLTMAEAFYLATKGGGSFFGKVGSFEEGYAMDALIVEDPPCTGKLSVEERLQRWIYTGDDRNIVARFVNGVKI